MQKDWTCLGNMHIGKEQFSPHSPLEPSIAVNQEQTSVDGSGDDFSQVEILLSAQPFSQHPGQRESARAEITCLVYDYKLPYMKSQHLWLLFSAALSEVSIP